MKFFVQQTITWQNGSQTAKLFDINSDSPIQVSQVKSLGRPNYELQDGESIVEKVLVNGIEQKDESTTITQSRKIEYLAKITKA
jgi:hypothetical protein